VIFGGAGYIGSRLAERFAKTGRFDRVHIADIRQSPIELLPSISSSITDVRDAIPAHLINEKPDWIFNLAAVHREPGHKPGEYFQTNIPGAKNVIKYAERTGCMNIYFTSSISVYGPTKKATTENSPLTPIPSSISKCNTFRF